jgi:hypothetical protein
VVSESESNFSENEFSLGPGEKRYVVQTYSTYHNDQCNMHYFVEVLWWATLQVGSYSLENEVWDDYLLIESIIESESGVNSSFNRSYSYSEKASFPFIEAGLAVSILVISITSVMLKKK